MQRSGLFGGSVNPIHYGHLQLAQTARESLGRDQVGLIPANVSPFKQQNPDMASGADRLAMCRLAAETLPFCTVDGCELERAGVSYTVATVRLFRDRYPEAELVLLVGSDMFLSLERWKSWLQILQQVTLCTAARSTGELLQLRRHARQLMPYGSTLVFDYPVLEVSSTQIRRRLKEGLDCSQLLPEKVYQQILQQNLYRG